jgi:hypothetical protein
MTHVLAVPLADTRHAAIPQHSTPKHLNRLKRFLRSDPGGRRGGAG